MTAIPSPTRISVFPLPPGGSNGDRVRIGDDPARTHNRLVQAGLNRDLVSALVRYL